MKSVHDPEIAELVNLSNERDARRAYNGRAFRSVHAALEWYYEARERMQAPNGLHPRGTTLPNGEVVVLEVDGGRGGDIHETLTTISVIGNALNHLRYEEPRAFAFVEMAERDGKTTRQLADSSGLSPATCSHDLGRGMSFLAGWMRREGIVR